MRRIIEFRWDKDGYRLHVNEQPANLRIYPEQRGDEAVMLSPDGRVVPSTVWYGEGGPYHAGKRGYALEEEAVAKELDMISNWFAETDTETEGEDSEYVPESTGIGYKPITGERLAVVMLIKREDGETETDTGFSVEKSGDEWNIIYDGQVWGRKKQWSDVQSMMSHVDLWVGDIIKEGPEALKEIIDRYSWSDRDAAKALFDGEKNTGVVVKSAYGGFVCYFNDFCPEDVFPAMEEAQIEATLRYTRDEYCSPEDDMDDEEW
jgi:hypothetical protein